MSKYIVKRHAGRSGQSVYEWRVYHVLDQNGRARQTQLAKYRSQETAEKAAEIYRANAARVAGAAT